MAAFKGVSFLILCCCIAFCTAQDDSKPDVSLLGIYQNITDIAAVAASLKNCSADDATCQALKELLIPPPPASAFAPGPGSTPFPNASCRKSSELRPSRAKESQGALPCSAYAGAR